MSNVFDLSNYKTSRREKEFYSTQKIFKKEMENELSRVKVDYDIKVDCIILKEEDNSKAINILECILYQLYNLELEDVFIFKKDSRNKNNTVLLYKDCIMKKMKLAK